MSEDTTLPPRTHNNPPVVIPPSEDLLADLQTRYPEVKAKLEGFEKDLATYRTADGKLPKLTLKDADSAKALQDLLGDMRKYKAALPGYKKQEKGPWDKLVKVVMNFFTDPDERTKALIEEWDPVHQDYLQQVADEKVRLANEEAARQAKIAEEKQREADAAEARKKEAEEREAKAKAEEDAARQRAAEEEAKKKAAQEAREKAEAEEKKLAEEKRQRERAEKEQNAENLRLIKRNMKVAETLHAAAEVDGEAADDNQLEQLDALIRPGGFIGTLATPVASSILLDDEQRTEIEGVRTRLDELRKAQHGRMDAKEKRRRAKLQKEADEREAKAAADRKLAREADEKRTADAKAAREKAEKEEAEAKAAVKKAEADARVARGEQRDAFSDQKAAGKEAAKLETEADRAQNRQSRIENRIENQTEGELSRTRGVDTVGSLRRSWKHYIEDENVLRAALSRAFKADADSEIMAVLVAQMSYEDLNGCVYRVMRLQQGGWDDRERVDDFLPGVVFAYEVDSQIR